MRGLLLALGLDSPPQVVHVVGTNGKGTVASLIDAGLRHAGRRSGLFTSPHVEDFRERIVVDGVRVSREAVVRFGARLQSMRLQPTPSFFEAALALALTVFAAHDVEIAVVEAGVGARHDATQALENVRLTVVTNVALDHTNTLGDTVSAIAADKAAAIRPGVPTVTGARSAGLEVLAETAAAQKSTLWIEEAQDPLFSVPHNHESPDLAQQQNLRLATAALRLLEVGEEHLESILAVPPLPARRERFVVEGRTVLLDGAHDPEAARLLRDSLAGPYSLVFGCLARKPAEAILEPLETGADAVVITDARAGEPAPLDRSQRHYLAEPLEALAWALDRTPPGGLVVVAGSLYLAGRVRPYLRRQHRT